MRLPQQPVLAVSSHRIACGQRAAVPSVQASRTAVASRRHGVAERGSVLIIVLWVAFGLVSLAIYFANSSSLELRAADNRVAALEAELTSRRVLPVDAVENHQDDPGQAQARADDLAAFTQRVMSELVRDRVPVSQIHPEVDRHMQPIRRP